MAWDEAREFLLEHLGDADLAGCFLKNQGGSQRDGEPRLIQERGMAFSEFSHERAKVLIWFCPRPRSCERLQDWPWEHHAKFVSDFQGSVDQCRDNPVEGGTEVLTQAVRGSRGCLSTG
jgi:hypothetical protein